MRAMEYHGGLWNTKEGYGKPRRAMKHHTIEVCGTPWRAMEYNRVPWNMMEGKEPPLGAIKSHETPLSTIEGRVTL